MFLVADFGNTTQKLAIFKESKLIKTAKFFDISIEDIKKILPTKQKVRASIISSVIDYPPQIDEFLNTRFNHFQFNFKTKIPIQNKYKTPKTLGYDRLSAAIAANDLFPENNVLIIDAGTCLKIDFIDKEANFWGGSIAPGIDLRFDALHTFTDHLPLIKKEKIDYLSGKSTKESILSGVMNGIIAEVNGIIEIYNNEFQFLKVILTGGDAKYFENKINFNTFAVPNLVLIGLHKTLLFNIENK